MTWVLTWLWQVRELLRHIEGVEQRVDRKRLAVVRRFQKDFEQRWNLDDKGAFKVSSSWAASIATGRH